MSIKPDIYEFKFKIYKFICNNFLTKVVKNVSLLKTAFSVSFISWRRILYPQVLIRIISEHQAFLMVQGLYDISKQEVQGQNSCQLGIGLHTMHHSDQLFLSDRSNQN